MVQILYAAFQFYDVSEYNSPIQHARFNFFFKETLNALPFRKVKQDR